MNAPYPHTIAVSRRGFIQGALGAAAATSLHRVEAATVTKELSPALIDVNIHLSRWPTRRVQGDEDTASLVTMLQRHGVTQAWAGSYDGLFHKDIASVNARLHDQCQRHGEGLLVPFGSIHPALPGWEEEMRRCAEEHGMRGIRVHPNYLGCKLDAPEFARLLRVAAERSLVVQLALVMEDERMMHPLLRVGPVDITPLAALIKKNPGLRLVLLNALRTLRGDALREVIDSGEVFVEISMLEGVGGVAALLEEVPQERVLFGSHAPLFYFESALLKLRESMLPAEQLRAIRGANASRLLAQNR